ncbi:hypothetical protein EZV62_026126 [Acer yangbiense]|uniref:non-specific serine/threonine protein kinase n=1 Tax=Acer yangbiense TaxID=1000413 RepID=A0A5C7GR96_9ROSI|nr:hypothetical protein EZV62_026126 [Acer yangbiense]
MIYIFACCSKMFPSRAWSFVAVLLLVWSSWSSLLIGADDHLKTHPDEVNALKEIKRSLIDVNNNLSSWNRIDSDPCKSNWTGVLCFSAEDGYLHVTELHLLNMNLSGNLSPALGRLSYLETLNFMWNNISGSIPEEIGNINSLKLLLLSGNRLTGSLPEKLGYLPDLDRIQIDENQISGSIPESFANLKKTKHFHMNNNLINGQIPSELFTLPNLLHFPLDNNNLSGSLPPEFSEMQNLSILQLDNNNFGGTTIPDSYKNMSKLLKLSLRNCSLQGPIPDLSRIPNLCYVDLSSNHLDGIIPPNKLSPNITTIDLSNNSLTGTIPAASFSDLPKLQKLDFESNQLSNISGSFDLPLNVTLRLRGNPLCSNTSLANFCGSQRQDNDDESHMNPSTNSSALECPQCRTPFEAPRTLPFSCFCAVPLRIGYRLKSPSFSYFLPYTSEFKDYLIKSLSLEPYQLEIESFEWLNGPRLGTVLKIFPASNSSNSDSNIFNVSEAKRIENIFMTWSINDPPFFGPYELRYFIPYVFPASPKGAISKGALIGIILGGIAAAVTLSAIVSLVIVRANLRRYHPLSKRQRCDIFYELDKNQWCEKLHLQLATNNFSSSSQVGQGGYGKVYKGILEDGTVVAIKRAQEGSLQGQREFLTEIDFLSRLHHRNLVSLVGYCNEEGEQMLVYEFMSRGTLGDQLSGMQVKIVTKIATKPFPRFNQLRKTTPWFQNQGYLDPEYFLTHQLTDKSDVYSLGVVFLELVTGMPPISHGKNIVREVTIAYQSGMIFSMIDRRMNSYPPACVEKFVTLALKCSQDETESRPSMAEVVRELENILLSMPEFDIQITELVTCSDHTRVVDPPSSSSSSTRIIVVGVDNNITDPAEVKALQDIKKNLFDINKNLSNWNRGDPCTSNWTGVLCFNTTKDDGYLHVRELQLLRMNLSGQLSPELGRLSYLEILDFMWNNITGPIPKEIGNIKPLFLLLLNGNQLTGSLPEELGYLPNLDRIQIDQNNISGPLPNSFANLNKTKHFHMNNNSISGQIPPELSRLPKLVHFLLDNNNLSGYLPPEFSNLPDLLIIQLDNNNFEGTTIPDSYSNMSKLLKLSLRNCRLQGQIPDLSKIPELGYLDLSSNQLNGSLPQGQLSSNITTINLSNNNLTGTIPATFTSLPKLQRLLIANNSLDGSVPSTLWQNRTLNANETLTLDFENNNLTNISGSPSLPLNVTLWLRGNPLCSNNNLPNLCGSKNDEESNMQVSKYSPPECPPQSCPSPYEYSRSSPVPCFCAAPLLVEYRLKSPGFSYFRQYLTTFEEYITKGLELNPYQLDLDSFTWQKGPRLRMYLKLFPVYGVDKKTTNVFNDSEVRRIRSMFTGWLIPDSDLFGPYELLDFILLEPYQHVFPASPKSGISKGVLIGAILGGIAVAVTLSAIIALFIVRLHMKRYQAISKRRHSSKISMKIDGVKSFTYEEMALATNNFSSSAQVGQGGYGKVYKGVLADGMVVAIKRAQEGSLQGEKEFLTEIQFLSRMHHRNLVSLVGYCDEEGEQMLVYEFMSNGTLRDQLSGIVPAHVSTVVKGTPGYLDPEYFLTHKLTDKSDVYSLGVVFLELLTGMQPISHGKNIVREVNVAYQSGMIFSVIDEKMGSYPSECVEKFVTLALKCCKDDTDARPSMAEVVRELENIWLMMPESDTKTTTEKVTKDPATKLLDTSPSASSSSTTKNPFVSSDVSGSNLVSGVIPTITPR